MVFGCSTQQVHGCWGHTYVRRQTVPMWVQRCVFGGGGGGSDLYGPQHGPHMEHRRAVPTHVFPVRGGPLSNRGGGGYIEAPAPPLQSQPPPFLGGGGRLRTMAARVAGRCRRRWGRARSTVSQVNARWALVGQLLGGALGSINPVVVTRHHGRMGRHPA